MSWLSDMVTIAAPAGVVSAVATHALAGLSERRSMRRQSRYLALRVAIILEQFAGDCVNLVSEVDVGVQLNSNPESLPTTSHRSRPFRTMISAGARSTAHLPTAC